METNKKTKRKKNYNDPVYVRIMAKKKIVNGIFEYTYSVPTKREKHADLLEEVLEQVEVCEAMLCPISIETIINWIESGNISKVRTEAKRIKFVS